MSAMAMSDKPGKKEEERWKVEDALHLSQQVQRLEILDADVVRKNPKMRKVLKEAHSRLGKLLGNGRLSEDDAKKEARKLGFGKKKAGDDDDEEKESDDE